MEKRNDFNAPLILWGSNMTSWKTQHINQKHSKSKEKTRGIIQQNLNLSTNQHIVTKKNPNFKPKSSLSSLTTKQINNLKQEKKKKKKTWLGEIRNNSNGRSNGFNPSILLLLSTRHYSQPTPPQSLLLQRRQPKHTNKR